MLKYNVKRGSPNEIYLLLRVDYLLTTLTRDYKSLLNLN